MRNLNCSGRGRLEAVQRDNRRRFRQSFSSSRQRLARSWWVLSLNDCCPATIRKGSGVTFQKVQNYAPKVVSGVELNVKKWANSPICSNPERRAGRTRKSIQRWVAITEMQPRPSSAKAGVYCAMGLQCDRIPPTTTTRWSRKPHGFHSLCRSKNCFTSSNGSEVFPAVVHDYPNRA